MESLKVKVLDELLACESIILCLTTVNDCHPHSYIPNYDTNTCGCLAMYVLITRVSMMIPRRVVDHDPHPGGDHDPAQGINDDPLLPRVVELRQLVGASTLSKGLSSHSVIRNAAKEEVRLLVMMRVS